jgi:hypothetical protein
MSMRGLGRLKAIDSRDKAYPMKAVIPTVSERERRYWWANGMWGNQGINPYCVGYGWSHWVKDGPVTHYGQIDPVKIYYAAQKVDEWEGEDYEGTSVRAGAKVLQSNGYISNYYWATDVNEIVRAVLEVGPVTVGTDWTSGMFAPDNRGFIKPTGTVAGGHCYVIDGVDTVYRKFRIKNSWGRQWGHKGFAYISISDFASLLVAEGEACLATEVKK